MKVGLDVNKEEIFLEVGSNNGLSTTVNMTTRTARAVGGQLIANADALDTALEEGNLGVDNAEA